MRIRSEHHMRGLSFVCGTLDKQRSSGVHEQGAGCDNSIALAPTLPPLHLRGCPYTPFPLTSLFDDHTRLSPITHPATRTHYRPSFPAGILHSPVLLTPTEIRNPSAHPSHNASNIPITHRHPRRPNNEAPMRVTSLAFSMLQPIDE